MGGKTLKKNSRKQARLRILRLLDAAVSLPVADIEAGRLIEYSSGRVSGISGSDSGQLSDVPKSALHRPPSSYT